MRGHPSILLLDDSPGECELFRQALAQTDIEAVLYTHQDAEAALHLLKVEAQAEVKLIILDWNLRNQHGGEFLRKLRDETRLTSIPVVVFSTSDDAGDLTAAYANGANGYVVKPATFADLIQCVEDICRYWMNRNCTPTMVMSRC